MKRLSVIIPMYNVEDYVERCIRSLENQDIRHDEYEIICINDGSPDNCREVIKLLQRQFTNIVLVDQENQGVSIARNNGISIAGGKYLLMIDPDDYVVENSLREVLEYADKADLEVMYLGFAIHTHEGQIVWQTDYSKAAGAVLAGVEGYYASRRNDTRDPDRSWAMLYRSDLIGNYRIRYPENVPYLEDGLFLVKVFATANATGFMDFVFYNRTIRPGSATNSSLFYSERAVAGFITAANDLKKFGNDYEFSGKQKELINHGIVNFVLLSLFPLIRARSIVRFVKTIRKLEREGYKKINISGVAEPYLSYAKKYNKSPLLFAVSYWSNLLKRKVSASTGRGG
ncbi:MAG TPA: glycosyltransferase [Bacteroidales bacterium]|nr:glycosyltransferase [Bacteroidales bacterium]HPR12810.1 glycosyltransferase [Bacteroidales bacterium]